MNLFVVVLLAATSQACKTLNAELLDVGFQTRAPAFINVDVPPGTVLRVEPTDDVRDDTLYVAANGPDDVVLTLVDGAAPGQVSLSVKSPMATLAPGQSFAPMSTLAGAGFTDVDGSSTMALTLASDGNPFPTTSRAAMMEESTSSSGSRLGGPLAVLSAAVGCWLGGADAAVACPVTVTVKMSSTSSARVRFTGLSAQSQLVCSLGRRRSLPTNVADVSFAANALDWAPSSAGNCLITSVFKKTSQFTSACPISMADTVTVTLSPSSTSKLFVNGQLSSALDFTFLPNIGSSGIAFTAPNIDGVLTTLATSLSTARAVVNVTKEVTTCHIVYSCVAGACLDGYSDDAPSFCAMFDAQPATKSPPVTVCANPPVDAQSALEGCRNKCGGGGMGNTQCDVNIRGVCCGYNNVTCFSDTKTTPTITCSDAWGPDCKSIGCSVLCNRNNGCPKDGAGSCPSSNPVCARRCSCYPPYCQGAFLSGFANTASQLGVAALALTVGVGLWSL